MGVSPTLKVSEVKLFPGLYIDITLQVKLDYDQVLDG